MLFIVAFVISVIFVAAFKDILKKYPNVFYIAAAIISIWAYILGSYVSMPVFVKDYVIGLFAKGTLGTAFFVLVMYAGAMKNTWSATKTLYKVRGELSIMGCIFVLCHNATYGRTYFRRLLTTPGSMSVQQRSAAIISMILIVIMLVLTITSFPAVRKKLNVKKWKQLQRSAYVFYGLIYIHILLINIPYARRGMTEYAVNVLVYSLVFVNYAMMRIHKAVIRKIAKASEDKKIMYSVILKVCLTVAGLAVIVSASLVSFAGVEDTDNDSVYASNVVDASVTELTTSEIKDTDNNSTKNAEETVADNSENESKSEDKKDEDNSTEDSNNTSDNKADDTSQESVTKADSQNGSLADTSNVKEDSNSSAKVEQETTTKAPETQAPRKFKADGTYTATAKCQRYNYMVSVQVVIANDAIAQVNASANIKDESDLEYFNQAAAVIPDKLVSSQSSSGVDTVSGATYSSKAIISAFNSAIN